MQMLTCFLLPQLKYQNEQRGMSHPTRSPLGFLSLLIFLLSFFIFLCPFTHLFSFVTFFCDFVGCFFFLSLFNYSFAVVVTGGVPELLRRWGGKDVVTARILFQLCTCFQIIPEGVTSKTLRLRVRSSMTGSSKVTLWERNSPGLSSSTRRITGDGNSPARRRETGTRLRGYSGIA